MDAQALAAMGAAIAGAIKESQATKTWDTTRVGKLELFKGDEKDWQSWSFLMETAANAIDLKMNGLLNQAVNAPSEPKLAGMSGDEERKLAGELFRLMVPLLRERPLHIARQSEKGNGFMLWRRLKEVYEPKVASRWTSVLMGILSPDWPQDAKEFAAKLGEWETTIDRWEAETSEKVTSNTRVAVLLKHAPREIQQAMRL